MSTMSEFLLTENKNRFVTFPIKHHDMWEMYEKHKNAIWFENEIDLTPDLKDWLELSDDERYFIKHILAFFAASDGIVMENIGNRFFNEIQVTEARSFYSIQLFMENIHSITYSQLIDTFITDNNEKEKLLNAIETIPAVSRKAKWAQKWINSNDSFAERLVAFAAVEGIFFSGSFCCIFWIREKGKMPGLCVSNDFIARDEGMHTDFACLLYNKYINNKLSNERIHEIFSEAVDIESEFITESLPCRLLGMNADSMKTYIKFVANRLLSQLGHSELYDNCKQPFGFMDRICLENKTNFFEHRTTEYQKDDEKTNLDEVVYDEEF